ncbi:MAG: hypothetical protein RLZZ444_2462 [Pseudomonadota bacterium]|jgi:hypothetical protein
MIIVVAQLEQTAVLTNGGVMLPEAGENGFVACVYKGLIDDFAARAVRAMARKVIKAARKKFGRLMLRVRDREVSAWDYYCLGLLRGEGDLRDRFISDYIRLVLLRKIEKMHEEEARLVEIARLGLSDIRADVVLTGEMIFEQIHKEVMNLAMAHGRSLNEQAAGCQPSLLDDLPIALTAPMGELEFLLPES